MEQLFASALAITYSQLLVDSCLHTEQQAHKCHDQSPQAWTFKPTFSQTRDSILTNSVVGIVPLLLKDFLHRERVSGDLFILQA